MYYLLLLAFYASCSNFLLTEYTGMLCIRYLKELSWVLVNKVTMNKWKKLQVFIFIVYLLGLEKRQYFNVIEISSISYWMSHDKENLKIEYQYVFLQIWMSKVNFKRALIEESLWRVFWQFNLLDCSLFVNFIKYTNNHLEMVLHDFFEQFVYWNTFSLLWCKYHNYAEKNSAVILENYIFFFTHFLEKRC